MSYILGIVVAEKIAGIVPEGTHEWEKFVPPEELQRLLESRKYQARWWEHRERLRCSLEKWQGDEIGGVMATNKGKGQARFSILSWWQDVCPDVLHIFQVRCQKITVLALGSCTAAIALSVVFLLGGGVLISGYCSMFLILTMLLKDFFKNVKMKPTTNSLVSYWQTVPCWFEQII